MADRWSIAGKRRRSGQILLLVLLAGVCGGCVESLPYTELPPLAKDAKPVLTAEQQKAAVGDMAAKSETKRSETIRAIETSSGR